MAGQVDGPIGAPAAACPHGCGIWGAHWCSLAPGPSGFPASPPVPLTAPRGIIDADASAVVDALRDIATALRESPRIVVVPVDAGGEIAPEALDQLVDALAGARTEATDCQAREHVTGPGGDCDPEE